MRTEYPLCAIAEINPWAEYDHNGAKALQVLTTAFVHLQAYDLNAKDGLSPSLFISENIANCT